MDKYLLKIWDAYLPDYEKKYKSKKFIFNKATIQNILVTILGVIQVIWE